MTFKASSLKATLVAGLILVGHGASAQIPVTDVLQLTQQIQQVTAWAQQYGQMASNLENQLTQIKNQYEQIKSITGGRGMGDLARNMIRQELPQDYVAQYDRLRQLGKGGASAGARSVLASIKSADCATKFPLDEQQRRSCEASQLAVPQNVDLINKSIESSRQRQAELARLSASIDTTDQKAASDLSNRMLQELAFLQNEKMMMDMALKAQEQQLALSQQQAAAEGARRLTRSSGNANPFNLN